MFSSAKAWWNPVFVSPFKVLVNVALPLKVSALEKGARWKNAMLVLQAECATHPGVFLVHCLPLWPLS